MTTTPEPFYRQRLTTLEAESSKRSTRQSRLTIALAFLPPAVVTLITTALHHHPAWSLAIPLAALLALTPFWFRNRRHLTRLTRLIAWNEDALARITHHPRPSAPTGEPFRPPNHPYDRDLNILGPASLFADLATTRTTLGQRALAQTLLHPPPPDEFHHRQQAIQDLTPLTGLREQIALLGANPFQSAHHDTFDTWLNQPPTAFPTLLRPILYLTSAIALLLLLAWFANRLPTPNLYQNLAAILAVQGAIALRYRAKALPILDETQPLTGQLQIVREGLNLIRNQPRISNRYDLIGADPALKALQNLFTIVEQRKKEWFYIPSLLLNAGTHAAIRINTWKLNHSNNLRRWLEAFADFEALNALATYAYEHPRNTYPNLLPEPTPPTFEATNLTHPLLPQAVPNDIHLNPQTRFYLISGSNMAGKSTLLRAIGLAVILARAGAPIPATRCRLSALTLGASLALTDSLAEGKSKFLAEVERIQHILTLARQSPTLYLIDELFSGTNSADRLTAARAILHALNTHAAIGALSTHDLALTTLTTHQNHGQNVHMTSPDPLDPLAFDYLLKPGINTTTNALAFLRLLNLEEI